MIHDDLSSALHFPIDDGANDAHWLAELIQTARQIAERVGHYEVVSILDGAYAAARAAAGTPASSAAN